MLLKIAIASDLHIGHGARAKDLTPFEPQRHTTESDYLGQFRSFVTQNDINADFLVLPGDISNSAHPSEFYHADGVIRSLAESLHVPPNHILFAPGNHDVDWKAITRYEGENISDHQKFGFSKRYDTIQLPNKIFDEVHKARTNGSLFEAPYYALWEQGDVLILVFNSANHDGPHEETHHGHISEESLLNVQEVLKTIPDKQWRAKICIVHHHPILYRDPISSEPDFSSMTNAEMLLSTLSQFKFDLLVHGHKHNPSFAVHTRNSLHPLAILAAGSFSHHLDSRWAGKVNNQFHVLEVHGRNEDTSQVYGQLKSYTYLCSHGWMKSSRHNGIDHTTPYGTYENPQEFSGRLETFVLVALGEKSYVMWSELCNHDVSLAYVPNELRVLALSDIAQRNSLICKAIEDDDFIILKMNRS